jgi:methyl-accepting chemotaxis protein
MESSLKEVAKTIEEANQEIDRLNQIPIGTLRDGNRLTEAVDGIMSSIQAIAEAVELLKERIQWSREMYPPPTKKDTK